MGAMRTIAAERGTMIRITSRLGAVAAALVLAFLALGAPADAVTQHARLDAFVSIFAKRPVGVKCYLAEEAESPWAHRAWAYVQRPLARQQWMHVDARMCDGALRVEDGTLPRWQRALAVLTLVHESYHLRRWRWAYDEAKVECRAIREWSTGARLLGASAGTIAELWPYALAFHYELANQPGFFLEQHKRPYYDASCRVPPLVEELS
jgi:hypothetical protein